jgi:hypothetical protein
MSSLSLNFDGVVSLEYGKVRSLEIRHKYTEILNDLLSPRASTLRLLGDTFENNVIDESDTTELYG